jgi:hypothetical protein
MKTNPNIGKVSLDDIISALRLSHEFKFVPIFSIKDALDALVTRKDLVRVSHKLYRLTNY